MRKIDGRCGCGAPKAKIDGRTLRDALKRTEVDNNFGKFSDTEWVDVCPKCNADTLYRKFPFLCHDGVMRTTEDLDPNTNLYKSNDLNFAGFAFSKSALYSSIELLRCENHSQGNSLWTENVEKLGKALARNPEDNSLLKFSKTVCTWGGGTRVWANLDLVKREKTDVLAKKLRSWLKKAKETSDAGKAISWGLKIKGLGVSFASKHLRMLNPEKFAVLDDVLSQGLGFARDVKKHEYKVFIQMLSEFKHKYKLKKCNVATLESGIFRLVRQQVRTRQSKDISGYPINKGTLYLFDSD